MQRKTVHYSGNVQGVGFRMTTRRIASDFDVTGYVKNLPDGRVELVAEGDAAEIDRFLDAVAGRMAGYIRDTRVDAGEASGQYREFSIAY